jgi:hypothetical protein
MACCLHALSVSSSVKCSCMHTQVCVPDLAVWQIVFKTLTCRHVHFCFYSCECLLAAFAVCCW